MPRAFYKHKLLLDEHLPARTAFPRLNQHFDVKHIAMDLNRAGTPDPIVYELAVSLGRIIVTRNDKDFVPLSGTKTDAGIIAAPPHWQPIQVDTKLTALLMKHGPAYFAGRLRNLTEQDG